MCVCVCVCVCAYHDLRRAVEDERAGDRDRDRNREVSLAGSLDIENVDIDLGN